MTLEMAKDIVSQVDDLTEDAIDKSDYSTPTVSLKVEKHKLGADYDRVKNEVDEIIEEQYIYGPKCQHPPEHPAVETMTYQKAIGGGFASANLEFSNGEIVRVCTVCPDVEEIKGAGDL